jgi:hypothetical protein
MKTASSTRPTFLFVAILAAAIISAASAPSEADRDRAARPPNSPNVLPDRHPPRLPDRQPHGQPHNRVGDVAPMDSHFSAYKLDRLVIVTARGNNRSGGFTTRLEAGKPDANPPEVYFRNIPPPRGTLAPQAVTPFDIAAYFTPVGDPEQIKVITAGRPATVEVKPIEEMPRSTDLGDSPDSPSPSTPRR